MLAPTGLGHLWIERGIAVRVARKIVSAIVGSWLRGPRTRYLFENRDDPGEFGLDPDDADVTIVGGAGVDPEAISPQRRAGGAAAEGRRGQPHDPAQGYCRGRRGGAASPRSRRAGRAAFVRRPRSGQPSFHPAGPRWNNGPRSRGSLGTAGSATWRRSGASITSRCYCPIARACRARWSRPPQRAEPIVATDVAGCREVVRDGQEGILVPLGDIDAAARALTTLAADPDLRYRLGAAANARFHERFTADAVRQKVRNLYLSLAPPP